MFTRTHYIKIANVLKANSVEPATVGIAHDLADMFKADNPRFDRDKFLTAAGVK